MKHTVSTEWKENLKFESHIDNLKLTMAAPPDAGGELEGIPPKKLLLSALAGCTGIDVVSILKKMRIEIEDFRIQVEAELTEEHPKYYHSFHLIYEFKGSNLDEEKLKKAIDLSQERYCGVTKMFGHFAKITYEIKTK